MCSGKPHTCGEYIYKSTHPTITGGFFQLALYYLEHKAHHIYVYCLLIYVLSSPLYAPLWLKFLPSWVAWLLCLCPTFPLVRLGHKGSTSAIVTAGSSGCVPQTGWSRKLAFLREYSVGELKMFLHSSHREPPEVIHIVISSSQFGHAHRCMHTQGKEPLTELFSLEDVSYDQM